MYIINGLQKPIPKKDVTVLFNVIGLGRRRRSNIGTWSTIAALGVGVGVASYALRRNQGGQIKNMLPNPGNKQGTWD